MAEGPEPAARIVLGCIQALGRPGAVGCILGTGSELQLVVTLEAQRASAASQRAVQEALGCGAPSGPLHVGFAAACRSGGPALGQAFDRVVFALGVEDLVSAGWLVPVRLRALEDGGEGDAAERVARAWLREAGSRPTLALAPSPAVGEALCAAVNRLAGLPCAAAVGERTRAGRRARLTSALASGELRLLATASGGVEGLDVPAVSCLLLLRRFRSDAAFARAVGRCLRPWPPEKADCLVLDWAGSAARRTLHPPVALFGPRRRAPGPQHPAGGDSGVPTTPRPHPAPRAEAPGRPGLAWAQVAPGVFLLGLPPVRSPEGPVVARDLVVRRLAGGSWAAEERSRPAGVGRGASVRRLWTSVPGSSLGRATAFGAAETALASDPAAHRFASASAAWRRPNAKASPAQVELLGQLGAEAPDGLDRASAAERIAVALARRRLVREIREASRDEGR
jgi:hypothetical protein